VATSTVTSNAPTTWTPVAFATVNRDELTAQTSSSIYDFDAPADYQGFCWIQFQKQASVNATGHRAVRVRYAGNPILEMSQPANSLIHTSIVVPFAFRSTVVTDQFIVDVAHNEGVTLSVTGSLWFNRTGPGPKGDAGPQGIAGPTGAVGAQGPIGPAGTIVTNTTTFAAIGGDDS
jgi:hypothetical protein